MVGGFRRDSLIVARLRLIYDTWGQDHMCELAANTLGDTETRAQKGTNVSEWRMFSKLSTGRIMERFGEKELEPAGDVPVPDTFGDRTFFSPAEAPSGERLKEIISSTRWPSWNAQSLRERPGKARLLGEAFQAKDWALLQKASLSAMLPVH